MIKFDDENIVQTILLYKNKVLRIKLSTDNKFNYYKILDTTSRRMVNKDNIAYIETFFIHCVDMKDNEETYLSSQFIVEIRENNLKEFE